MQVWIGLKQGDEYVSEWTGEIAGEEEIGTAIGQRLVDYRKSSGRAIWGMTIMIDKAASQRYIVMSVAFLILGAYAGKL
jgi:hypothetical protein